jgi:hypothetical protein
MRKVSLALVVSIAFLGGLVLVYLYFEESLNWKSIAALASILVLFWAVLQQTIIKWLDQPDLKILDYKHEPPFFRPAPEFAKGIEIAKGYYVNLVLINKGKTVAYNVQPHLSARWEFKKGIWHQDRNWIPIGLRWVFDEQSDKEDYKPIEEKNLVSWRPYRFNLLRLSTSMPFSFALVQIFYPTGQPGIFSTGKYCFEVTITADRLKPVIRYYRVDFHEGGINEDFDSVKRKIDITDRKKPPR